MIPYPHTVRNGNDGYRRVKPDRPFAGDGHERKYLSPKRTKNPEGNRLYLPPNLCQEALNDPSVSLIVTEGEKKTLAGNQEGFLTVGLAGVACWVGRN